MKLSLSYENIDNIKKVNVKCGKYNILVSKESQKWNQEGINEFLINIASSIPEGEIFEIEFDQNNDDEMYKYIYSLFNDFCNEYNNLLSKDSSKL